MAVHLESLADAAFAENQTQLSGFAVQVTRGAQTLLAKSYGFSDMASRRSLLVTDTFRIGSITKQFTAAAVLQLAEAGKLRLDAPLVIYLPEYSGPGRLATIGQLLSHTTGLKDYTELAWYTTHETTGASTAEVLQVISQAPLSFAIGERFEYSNSGYYLLGLVIERLSGQRYAEFLETNVFVRAELSRTRYCPDTQDYPGAALGHQVVNGRLSAASPVSMTVVYASGALCSTVGDLVRWSQALSSGRVVSRESYARMRTPTSLPNGSVTPYGFGLGVGELLGSPVIGHNGEVSGFVSELTYLPRQDSHIVVLVNTDNFVGLKLVRGLADALIEDTSN